MFWIYLGLTTLFIASIIIFFKPAFKYGCLFFCISFLCALIFILTYMKIGWDFNIFCAASYAVNLGLNPYYVKNLQIFNQYSQLSFVYPVFSLIFFSPFCNLMFQNMWVLFYIVLLIGAIFIIYITTINLQFKTHEHSITTKLESIIFICCVCLCAFNGVLWNFATGNTGIFELFFISLCFWLFKNQKFILGSLILGFIGSFKIIPLSFALALYLFVYDKKSCVKKGTKLIMYVIIGVGLVHLSSFLFNPSWYYSYLLHMIGKLSQGTHSPILENYADWSNPTFLLLIKDILKIWGISNIWLKGAIVSLIFIILYIPLHKILFYSNINNFIKFSLAILFLALISIRLKPYSFTLVIPAVIFLALSINQFYIKSLIVLISSSLCLIPFFWKLLHPAQASSQNFISTSNLIIETIRLKIECIQSISLLLVFLIISAYFYRQTYKIKLNFTYFISVVILTLYSFLSILIVK